MSPFLLDLAQFVAMAISLPDGTPLPEPMVVEKPSEDANPDEEKKPMSKSAMKKLAKGKVRLIVLPVCL
jgi:hypothetical protein